MRAFLTVSILAVVLALPASGFAADAHRSNPYESLFTARLGSAPDVASLAPTPPSYPLLTRTVVCGLTVMQGNSKIDPAMPHQPPANARTPSIKIVPAPACRK